MNFSREDTMPRTVLTLTTVIALAQVVFVMALVLPAHDPEPHDAPVGFVGSSQASAQLEPSHPVSFDARHYASPAAAEQAIRDRDVYGALVPGSREVMVASAASPVIAQALQQQAPAGTRVRDLVAIDRDDPRGATLNALFLPLIIASLP